MLTGNSTSLARWDAKLGFQTHPFIAGLRSLQAAGGAIPMIDIEIVKIYPVGYFETTSDGTRVGPTCEAEERQKEDRWMVSLFGISHSQASLLMS